MKGIHGVDEELGGCGGGDNPSAVGLGDGVQVFDGLIGGGFCDEFWARSEDSSWRDDRICDREDLQLSPALFDGDGSTS